MNTLICSILVLALLGVASAGEDHCYALALEGGGDKGAFQAGAMHEIVNHHADETVAYDIVTGISVGAINGAGLANYEVGDELEAVDWILDLWRGLTRDNVIKQWAWGGVVHGLLFETGIYDDTPLEEYLRDHLFEPKREFIYGLTDMASGKYIAMDAHEDFERYFYGVIGSAAFPGVLPAIKNLDEGHVYVDGGVARAVDIASAVNFCKDKMGQDETKITIDIILNGGATFKVDDSSTYKSVKMGLRYLEIRSFYKAMDHIIRA
jgi:predicted acylesterase/phospholipase RssA